MQEMGIITRREDMGTWDLKNLLKVSWDAWRGLQVHSFSNVLQAHQEKNQSKDPYNQSQSVPAIGAESPKNVECGRCGRRYKLKSSLRNHQKWECGKEPRFQCPYCVYRAKQKMHVERHIERMHKEQLRAFYDSNEALLENDVHLMFDKMKDLSGQVMSEARPEAIRQP